ASSPRSRSTWASRSGRVCPGPCAASRATSTPRSQRSSTGWERRHDGRGNTAQRRPDGAQARRSVLRGAGRRGHGAAVVGPAVRAVARAPAPRVHRGVEVLAQIQSRRGLQHLDRLPHTHGDVLAELRLAVGGYDGERLDTAVGCRQLVRDLRQRLEDLREHGRLVELLVGLCRREDGFRLRLAPLRDRTGIGRTLQPDGLGLGPALLGDRQRLRLRVDLEGACVVLRFRQRGLCRLLPLVALRVRTALGLVALGVGGLADLADEFALPEVVLRLRDLLLLVEDALLLLAARELLRGTRRSALDRGLPLDLRVAQIERLLRFGDVLPVAVLRLRRFAQRFGFRDAGLLRDERGLRTAEVAQVVAVVLD